MMMDHGSDVGLLVTPGARKEGRGPAPLL